MMSIVSLLLSGVLSGGATGLLGVLLQRFFDERKRGQDLELAKLQNAQALQLRQMELATQERMANQAAAAQQQAAELDAQARETEAAVRGLQASQQADRATYLAPLAQQQSRVAIWLMAGVDAARGIIRPGVTVYSLYLLTLLMLWVRELYQRSGQAMTPEQAHELANAVIGTVNYLAVTCTVWWFGVRGPATPRR